MGRPMSRGTENKPWVKKQLERKGTGPRTCPKVGELLELSPGHRGCAYHSQRTPPPGQEEGVCAIAGLLPQGGLGAQPTPAPAIPAGWPRTTHTGTRLAGAHWSSSHHPENGHKCKARQYPLGSYHFGYSSSARAPPSGALWEAPWHARRPGPCLSSGHWVPCADYPDLPFNCPPTTPEWRALAPPFMLRAAGPPA